MRMQDAARGQGGAQPLQCRPHALHNRRGVDQDMGGIKSVEPIEVECNRVHGTAEVSNTTSKSAVNSPPSACVSRRDTLPVSPNRANTPSSKPVTKDSSPERCEA